MTDNHGSAPFSLFFARSFPSFRRAALPVASIDASQVAPATDPYDDWRTTVDQMESLVFPALRELRDNNNAARVRRFNSAHRLVSFSPGS